MTDRRLSPTAAQSYARRAVRQRMRALRLDPRHVSKVKVDSHHVFAGRLVALLTAASHDNPGVWSEAYSEHVLAQFSDQYLRLCEVAPLARVGS